MIAGDTRAPDGAVHRSPLAWLLVALVRVYRATAIVRTPRCRFHPTCSSYALQAIRTHGGLRGGWLAVRRVGRCNPWNPGGIDHVPPTDRSTPTGDPISARPPRK